MQPALRVLNRYGLGARSGEVAAVRDPREWLAAQLEGPPPSLRDQSLPVVEAAGDALREVRVAQ